MAKSEELLRGVTTSVDQKVRVQGAFEIREFVLAHTVHSFH